jgi:uncharacterized RDD family membrane protein YckC
LIARARHDQISSLRFRMSDERYSVSEGTLTDAGIDQALPVESVGRGRRFANLLIDYVCFFILSALLGVVVVMVWGDAGLAALERIPDFVLGIVVMCAYYIPLEATWGRTIGKLITGTKVVNEDGRRPSFAKIIGRTFSRFIPFEAFSFFGADARGWHDTLSKTYVVKCR